MADKRISQLIERVDIANNDVLPIVASGATTTNKVTISTIQNWMQDNLDVGVTSVGITIGSTGTDVNVTGSPITTSGNITINIPTASATNRGLLSSTDWSTFNNKVPYTGATGNVNLGEYGISSGFVTLDTTPTGTPASQGTIYWDDSRSTAALIMNGTTQHIGQDSFFYVKNSTGYTIPKGTGVGFAGTDGASGHLLIQPFLANGSQPSTYFMGVTAEAITNGGFGQVMQFGELSGINTSGYTAGALLYASTSVAGAFQTTAPQAPNNIILVAAAVNSTNNGSIIVRPQIGSNINTDEGVKITSVADKDLLQYQSGTGLWENKTRDAAGVVTTDTTQTITGLKTFSGSSLRLAANGTADAVVLRNVSGTTGSDTGATTIGFNGNDNIFVNTQSRGGFILGFNNSVSNREYTLPDASGTIALTSNLSSYLPLSGGTLTGALNGTSASFTGNVSSGGIFIGRTTNGQAFGVGNGVDTDLGIFVQTNNILFSNSGASSGYAFAVGGSTRFSISSTGAATFSSSVQGTQGIFQSSQGSILLRSTGTASPYIDFYTNTSSVAATMYGIDGGGFAIGVPSTERMRITSSGNVGIGTASPNSILEIAQASPQVRIQASDSGTFHGLEFRQGAGLDATIKQLPSTGEFRITSGRGAGWGGFTTFYTDATERMRITSGGYLKASNTGTYLGVANSYHELNSDFNTFRVVNISNTNNTSGNGAIVSSLGSNCNNTNSYHYIAGTGGADILYIYGNGNVVNTNNSYGSLSDVKIKENIEDATPKLDDLMKVKVRNYNLIGDDKKQIGVIAQELEEVFPAMIDESEDFEEVEVPQVDEEGNEVLNEEGEVVTTKERVSKGTTTKSVKYSVFVPMLIKAMQEQQEQIKSLTEQIEALKSQING